MTGYNETQGTITNTCSGRSCFLLHSAPVAHGNSGGPLMDATSQAVVGINTAIHRRAKNTYIATRANYVVAAVRQAQEAQAALAAKKAPPGLGEACKDLIVTIAKARLGQDLDMGEEIVRIHPRLMAKSLQALSTETKLNTQVPKLKKDAYAATTMIALVQIISRGLPPGAIPSPESCREIPAPSFTDASEPTAVIDIPDTEHRVSKATFKWSHGAWRLWDFSR